MTLSCLHTHTTFCDGKTDVETMCEAAFVKGFSVIGFSSHAPITKKTGLVTEWHLKDERLDEYIDAVLAARKRWQGKLAVYLGLEVDYIQGLRGPADADIQALPLDYVIGSVHYVLSPKNGEPFAVDSKPEDFPAVLDYFDRDGRAVCKAYYGAFNGLVESGGADILGHLDLVKKHNAKYHFFSPDETWYQQILVTTADGIAAARSKAEQSGGRVPVVEVNTSCLFRGFGDEPYPSRFIQGLLNERNVPLVINADAHQPDHLGGGYEAGRAFMKKAGYTATVLFDGRENGQARWREEAL